jgi:hypothetical protein
MELTDVKNVIEIILPNITSESCKRLLEKLAEIGVESREDLPIVREEDLSGILKPIQMRKLMNGWAILHEVCMLPACKFFCEDLTFFSVGGITANRFRV